MGRSFMLSEALANDVEVESRTSFWLAHSGASEALAIDANAAYRVRLTAPHTGVSEKS